MKDSKEDDWTILRPPLTTAPEAIAHFRAHAKKLATVDIAESGERLERINAIEKQSIAALKDQKPKDRPVLKASIHILTDLARQAWNIEVTKKFVRVRAGAAGLLDPKSEKARIRRQELVKRDEQLREQSVRDFVQDMERRRLWGKRFVSVFSLMRDGADLAERLKTWRGRTRSIDELKAIVDPYVQVVDSMTVCEHTGLRLTDIWRYFRHTWSNQYVSTPGRTMMLMVRDRAAPFHPVIGIAALSSPIVQIGERDDWIGWSTDAFLVNAPLLPYSAFRRWLHDILATAIDELYVADFLENGIVEPKELKSPTDKSIKALRSHSLDQRDQHYKFVSSREGKRRVEGDAGEDAWEVKARGHLFQSKRAAALAEYLDARRVIEDGFPEREPQGGIEGALCDKDVRHAVGRVLRKARADRVGIAMADISVCGAVAPYGSLLGGKLVAMLTASPEVVQAYRDRYEDAESEIASSMAGRAIRRKPDLVLLCTTSLYGAGSSQYNRIRIPAETIGGTAGDVIEFKELGRSEAYGTSHFSSESVDALENVASHAAGGRKVNSIFGEGVSPKLRKIRDGLTAIGFPSDDLLRHGRERIIYGVTLASNMSDYLLGFDSKPNYMFQTTGAEATAAVSEFWRTRWLSMRAGHEPALEEARMHTLLQPIRHGARVQLPKVDPTGDLFDRDF